MSLADHWDGGWLQAGWHHVRVTEHEITSNPKKTPPTPGVEFKLACVNTGAQGRVTCWTTPKALGVLASFARACGMTREEAVNYDPSNPNDHRKLVGLECYIELVKKDKYHEVVGWRPVSDGQPSAPPVDRSNEATTPTAAEANNVSDCPF